MSMTNLPDAESNQVQLAVDDKKKNVFSGVFEYDSISTIDDDTFFWLQFVNCTLLMPIEHFPAGSRFSVIEIDFTNTTMFFYSETNRITKIPFLIRPVSTLS